MKKNRNITIMIYFLGILLFFVTSSIFYFSSKNTSKYFPKAVNGVLDLSQWDFNSSSTLPLDGEWEFYYNQLLTPEDFKNNANLDLTSFIKIPGNFTNADLKNYKPSSTGYATYRLKIKLKDKNSYYGIKSDFISTAYNLWVDDRLLISSGKVGTSKDTSIPQMLPKENIFTNENREINIILQASNFEMSSPQIDSIFFGTRESILRAKTIRLAFDLFIFGATFIIAIYLLVLYIKNKSQKSALLFSIVSLLICIRTLFVGERFFIYLFPNFNWNLQVKICHITFLTYVTVFLLYIDDMYKNSINPLIIKISKISTYAYVLAIMTFSSKFYTLILIPYEILSLGTLVYICCKLFILKLYKEENCLLALIGVLSILISTVNDVLYEFSLIQTGSYAAFGILIFIILQSYISAEKFASTFNFTLELSEKLKVNDKLKDDFLAHTSYELKAPLNSIIGISDCLLSDNNSLSKPQSENIELIKSSSIKLSQLVNDIMDFTRLNNNDIVIHKNPIPLKNLVEIVILKFHHTIKNKEILVYNQITDDIPLVLADENRLEQIFYNLIGNALKYTKYGSVTISAEVIDDFARISIKDTGIGIPEHKLNSIFDPYEKLSESSLRMYNGIGIRLNITKRFIELHGGEINVISKVNEGSNFIFTLPICKEEKAESTLSFQHIYFTGHNDEQITPPTLGKSCYNILIVDDDLINQKILKSLLTPYEFSLVFASSGKSALEIINSKKNIDMLIIDTVLPDMLGYEVCSMLRDNYSLFELPILMLTNDDSSESLVISFECGANDYLKKPLDKLELISRIKTLLTLKTSVKNALTLQMEINNTHKKVEELKYSMDKSQKKINEILEYDKIKTEFFANISHELRTPLNVIWSCLQLINTLDPSISIGENNIQNYTNIMRQNCLRLIRLINNLIDITKIDGNYLTLEPSNQDIVYVVEEITLSVAKYIESQGISLIFDTDVEEKLMAFDSEKIERIMLNLLSNAVKFTPKGGTIEVNLWDLDDKVKICVKDTGIGIPEDKLQQVFDRFIQVDKSLSRQTEGSGIGLSLVKSLVELHGGNIYVKSEYGKGSEFIIEIPAYIEKDCDLKLDNDNSLEMGDSRYIDRIKIEFSDIYL